MNNQTDGASSLLVKRRGRPRVEEPRTAVSTWLPVRQHDRLIQLANQNEQSVSDFVRKALEPQLTRR